MTDIKITGCRPEDWAAIRSLSEETFRETFLGQNSEADMVKYLRENFSKEKIKAEMDTAGSLFFLACIQGRAAAYMKLNTGEAQTEPGHDRGLEIQRIYVLKNFKNRRIGSALIQKAAETAKELSLDHIWLGVWEKNHSAIGFYEKQGFIRFGEHLFKLGDDEQTDHLMRKDLT